MAAKRTSTPRKTSRPATRPSTPRKAARPSTRRAPAEPRAVSVKGRRGNAAAGQEMTPDAGGPLAAAAGLPELMQPRPYTSRYPISEQEFVKLKARATHAKVAKGKMAAAVDAPAQTEHAGAAAALAEGTMEPSAAPSPSVNFAGIAATGWIPPDCTMATGPSHVLLSVNSSVAVLHKATGTVALQRTLTQWFSNVVQNLTIFDPKALFDQHAGRWVLLAVAFRNNPNQSVFLLSVSSTSNPLGPWRNYVLDAMKDGNTSTSNWADYPGLGVDHSALYVTANMFAFGGGFQYAKIRVIPKAGPYSGGAAPFFDFVRMRNPDNSVAFTIQPCHTFGAPQVEYLVNSRFPSGSSLTLWRITNPTTAPSLVRAAVATGAYTLPPNADQSGGAPPLNTGDVRIQHAVFRGDSIWTALTTTRNWGAGNRASIHWFQIRGATSALVQQGVYGARALHYSYPAGCPDNNGNFVMAFSRSGSTEFGSFAYTGRRSTDALGTLQTSVLLKAGVAHYVRLDGSGRNRWGDYNGVAADPSHARLVWLYSEYASAVNTWATWVGSAFF
jgi:hypothetical protein